MDEEMTHHTMKALGAWHSGRLRHSQQCRVLLTLALLVSHTSYVLLRFSVLLCVLPVSYLFLPVSFLFLSHIFHISDKIYQKDVKYFKNFDDISHHISPPTTLPPATPPKPPTIPAYHHYTLYPHHTFFPYSTFHTAQPRAILVKTTRSNTRRARPSQPPNHQELHLLARGTYRRPPPHP